ncbi:MAG TPA: ParB/RepB/Spo0J family partition protein [Candidatus Limnocylindria bacterium]|nr:ParB/RepB/Spo0J family partition protein [Candidatus Limnocylindria bacterium]
MASPAPRAGRGFGLGRGLEALIPRDEGSVVRRVPVERIASNRNQPRARFDDEELGELAASIAVHGVLHPIVVRALPDGAYELIAGERRLRAARLAGLSEVPVTVRDADDGRSLEMALVENLQRADLNPIEEALAYRELIDRFALSHEAVARQVGKSRVAISNALRLLDLHPDTKQAIVDRRISEGHGRALASLTAPELQRTALDAVLTRRLSVRQTEELVRRLTAGERRPARRDRADDLADLEAQLRGMLATRVGIQRTRRGGRMVIEFYSDEELDRLYSIIERGARDGADESEAPSVSSAGADRWR